MRSLPLYIGAIVLLIIGTMSLVTTHIAVLKLSKETDSIRWEMESKSILNNNVQTGSLPFKYSVESTIKSTNTSHQNPTCLIELLDSEKKVVVTSPVSCEESYTLKETLNNFRTSVSRPNLELQLFSTSKVFFLIIGILSYILALTLVYVGRKMSLRIKT